jgi:hypothetical protein
MLAARDWVRIQFEWELRILELDAVDLRSGDIVGDLDALDTIELQISDSDWRPDVGSSRRGGNRVVLASQNRVLIGPSLESESIDIGAVDLIDDCLG